MEKNLLLANCKSYLWTSALMVDKYNYAQKVGAHVTILDLEDSVPPEKKDTARGFIVKHLTQKKTHLWGIRINSIRTEFGLKDLDAMINSTAEPDIVMLPKVESAEEVIIVNQLFASKNKNIALCAIIESSRGLKAIHEIAAIKNNLAFLLYGPADFSAEIGTEINWSGFNYVREQLVLAAAFGNIAAIDTADFSISDIKAFKQSCSRARNLGFVGKVAIHPSQVAVINQAFMPTKKELTQAKTILQKSKQDKSSVFTLNGRMYGPPMVKLAESILSRAGVSEEEN